MNSYRKKMTKYGGEWGGEFMIIYAVGGYFPMGGGKPFWRGGIDPGRNHVTPNMNLYV